MMLYDLIERDLPSARRAVESARLHFSELQDELDRFIRRWAYIAKAPASIPISPWVGDPDYKVFTQVPYADVSAFVIDRFKRKIVDGQYEDIYTTHDIRHFDVTLVENDGSVWRMRLPVLVNSCMEPAWGRGGSDEVAGDAAAQVG
jgi:hypothetical protein